MKKTTSILLIVILLCSLFVASPVTAASASASLTGSNAVRAGDTVTLSFQLNGTGILGVTGTLEFDSGKLTLTGTAQSIAAPWSVEVTGNDILAYDDQQTSPINSNTTMFTATFKVNASLQAGTSITVSVKNIVASNGAADIPSGTATYSTTILAPKSTNNNLSKLTVSNAQISPAFAVNTIAYSAKVPFSISKLDISAVQEDTKATVSVTGNSLSVGTNTVKITVTAENGSVKVYTITVTREQDPNYKANSNANLTAITTDNGQLSPAFSTDKTSYVVYVPFEVTHITLGGTAEDGKAQGVEGVSSDLKEGNNKLKVIGKAEDGTKKEYNVIVVRMSQYTGNDTVNLPVNSDISSLDNASGSPSTKGSPIWLFILIGILCLGIGSGATFLVMRKIR